MTIHPRPTGLFAPDDIARSHAADPKTSIRAAAKMNRSGRAAANLARVIEAVRTHPGKTSGELAELIEGLDLTEVRRRLTDAAKRGDIARGAARKCGVCGTEQGTYSA